eukprot:12151567-Karenia_brevis.AAC.1
MSFKKAKRRKTRRGKAFQDKLPLAPCTEGEHEDKHKVQKTSRLHTDDEKQVATSPLELKVKSCLGASCNVRAIEKGGGGDCFFLS